MQIRDFQPINIWEPDKTGHVWQYGNEQGQPMFLIDRSTGRQYINESENVVRKKCVYLTLGTLFVHAITGIINIAVRILMLGSFAHFWLHKEEKYDFTGRLWDAGKDLVRIVATPFAIAGLEFAAIYGIYSPYDGRKLYASIERALYGDAILAPCFQPEPDEHFFGGDIARRDVY